MATVAVATVPRDGVRHRSGGRAVATGGDDREAVDVGAYHSGGVALVGEGGGLKQNGELRGQAQLGHHAGVVHRAGVRERKADACKLARTGVLCYRTSPSGLNVAYAPSAVIKDSFSPKVVKSPS